MIFIKYNEKNIVTFINYVPFDEQFGTKLTKEEMKSQGALVDDIPMPKSEKNYIHKYDVETNTVYCEFISSDESNLKDKVFRLEQENASINYILMKNDLL